MKWIAFFKAIAALISLVSKLADVKRDQRTRLDQTQLGRLQAVTEALHDAQDIINRAETVRRDFHDRLSRNPSRLQDNDGFKREPPEPKSRDPTARSTKD